MEFKEYVNSLPNQRDELMENLATLCRVSKITVYRWFRGDFLPDALKRKVIADYLQISEKELWPNV
ncbi:helix-turn-helix transcriptional regulator [Prevotella sp. HUN102]|uniref:helix-turn-helix domain-containing protein n=1 Tax=Prevotella sp. HUN102 TaxID=1392486 RepID=UPI00048E3D2F|nr:helix-turn-helix transcriptional regulator [Prevotella sp. HUN102]